MELTKREVSAFNWIEKKRFSFPAVFSTLDNISGCVFKSSGDLWFIAYSTGNGIAQDTVTLPNTLQCGEYQVLNDKLIIGSAKHPLEPVKEDYPKLPETPQDVILETDLSEFRDNMEKVFSAVATEPSRYAINHGLLECPDYIVGTLPVNYRLIATDGKRMHMVTRDANGGSDLKPLHSIMINPDVFQVIKKLTTKNSKGKIGVAINGTENWIHFLLTIEEKTGTRRYSIISRIGEGVYPSYRDVVPRNPSSTLIPIDDKDFINFLKDCKKVAKKNEYKAMIVEITGKRMLFSMNCETTGSVLEYELYTLDNNASCRFGIDPRFFLDSIINLNTSSIKFTTANKDPENGAFLVISGNYQAVLMPINIGA